jgi:uncharacterized protein YyaL (SSP411 family)
MTSPRFTNRLAKEASPYLRQHGHNPVDWYPWGPEALAAAKAEDKPILLSIGYSACHWCHVMERESFEDEAIAARMNASFVNVKVDREERPDLDQIYQLVVQLLGRSGGWPLTVFLTPDQKPFFGGTYFPPADRYGMPGFPKVLEAIASAYRDKRGEIVEQAQEIASAIASATKVDVAAGAPSPGSLGRAAKKLSARFDDQHGGFGARPKFPNTMALAVLLRQGVADKDEASLHRVQSALGAMRAGGIYDQLGGGFHRYSTDEKWLVPHFEKMLYDNALLVRAYTDGHRVFHDESHRETVLHVAEYLRREMTDASGAFYASQDADSEGVEGKFFVWTRAEVSAALASDPEAHEVALRAWGVTDEGNFEESGATVLSEAESVGSLVVRLHKAPSVVGAALERARQALFAAREQRPKPFRDEKVLASWNALTIGALADAGAALRAPELVAMAERAFAAIESKLVKKGPSGSRVERLTKDGIVKGPGFLDDHAYVADAALDLYEATGTPSYVATARSIADAILAHFADREEGGFFFTPDDAESLIVRAKDAFDHAVPSGTAVACRVLLRLGTLVDAKYTEIASKELERLAATATENPFGLGETVGVLDGLVRGSVDIVLVGPHDHAATRELAAAAFEAYLPSRVIAWADPNDAARMAACALVAEGKPGHGEPVAYVCRGRTCSPPVRSADELRKLLAH